MANPTPIPTAPNGDTGDTDAEGANGIEGNAVTAKAVPTGPMPEIERGLCVVCQDEEATLAVVDCGHLAMCAREYGFITLFCYISIWSMLSQSMRRCYSKGRRDRAKLFRLLGSYHGYESRVSIVPD